MNNILEVLILYSDNVLYFFIACCLLLSFGFPAWSISFSAGFFYGICCGIVFALCASTTAVLLEYLIGNLLFSKLFCSKKNNYFRNKAENVISKINRLNSLDNKTFFWFILLLKLNPLVPFAVISFVWKSFNRSVIFLLTCNFLGAIPLASLWVFQGYSIRGLANSNNFLTTVNEQTHSSWYYLIVFILSLISILVFSKLLKTKTHV